jgi:hypothetical protein
MDEMEATIQQLRVQALLQRSVSDSVNPGRLSPPDVDAGNDSGNSDHGTTPMDTKDTPQHLSRASDVQ